MALALLSALVLLGGEPDFAQEVRPLLAAKCFTCHGPDAPTREAGLRLDIHEGYGAYEDEQGWTKYLNASTSTLQYRPISPPIVLDVPLDRSLPARWVSVGDEEVTRLDLKDGVGRALPIRRRESATSLLSSNTSTASSSSLSELATATALATPASGSITSSSSLSKKACLAFFFAFFFLLLPFGAAFAARRRRNTEEETASE